MFNFLKKAFPELKNLSGSYGLGEIQVELKYGKGCNGWGIRRFKTFKQDMRNSLKRIEKYLGLNNRSIKYDR